MSSVSPPIKEITAILLGKTGYGKSATGNTLLGFDRFEVVHAISMTSITKIIHYESNTINGLKWNVYDPPGLMNSDRSVVEDIKTAVDDMSKVMRICHERNHGGIVFLLIYNISSTFTAEDRKTYEVLESIFGNKNFWNRCVLVLTNLDTLEGTFDEWLSSQRGSFTELKAKCGENVVAVCNRDNNDERRTMKRNTRDELQQVILRRARVAPSYTLKEFNSFENVRKNLVLQYELPSLETDYNRKINEIKEERLRVKSRRDREAVLQKIAILKDRIVEKDNGTGKLRTYMDSLDLEIQSRRDPWCVIL
ncbi:GTPase IMAP family member 7-like isoform X1 [Biomphalaria glabrata]|uniref:GTPase IMAP family member 7-like isoform X1 n=1 Tax=Biomphalaria glabrata TaxID=6526 RepID=A0A9U8ENE2_BIOGL|nr:GTPase IMAP family member 7-like isoform X1 [Biomphalaria glabrata]KAI8779058.1 AIG protein [Biomphalaria glabrata]